MTGSRVVSRAILVPAIALAIAGTTLFVFWSDLSDDERGTAAALLTPARTGVLVLSAIVLAGVLGIIVWRLLGPAESAARSLAESARLIAHGNPGHRIASGGTGDLAGVAAAVNDLADERSRLLVDVGKAVAEAKSRVEEERSRLAALVAQLDQAVLVCNRDGRILLFNAAAGMLLCANDGGEALGLGRSVFALLDRAVVLHAVEALERQLGRDHAGGAHFVTATHDGRLLRARAAAVGGPGDAAAAELAGYVLLLADVTRDVDADARRATLLQELVEATRAALANIRAAIENLTDHPQMDAAHRSRFTSIIRDESVSLSDRLDRLGGALGDLVNARWPLEEMIGEDLVTLAQRRIERRTGLPTKLERVERDVWLSVDSFSLAQAFGYLAQRLKDEFAVREVRFRLERSGTHAHADLIWQGPPMSSETAFAWQREPFSVAGEDSPLTLADVVQRHGGEAWYQRDIPAQRAYFRVLLPLAGRPDAPRARSKAASRPEFYDFDLFRRSPATDLLDERQLDELAYTAFDTETTGLAPSQGDEIIAIGAVRIVNGRLLAGETFDVLVDPGRSLEPASIAVHGIRPDMLRGQPAIEAVLPRFHRFAEETVLVGHNAAFDLRFLELKEARTGIRFSQPVLDTLLLSALVHPAQDAHGLEDIAARLGVPVVGRHTALGDALLTAEVFLRLLVLLRDRGITTLGEARTASERTYYARLAY